MKVLIVSENFFKGGLEKQIINQYKTLNDKVEYVFALSNYENTFLNDKNVYKLKDDYSLISLVENIKVLIKIIEKENIDVIHVHPYYSIFPAMFASQIKNIPICTTVHGINSLNFPKSTNIKLLQRLFYSESKPLVFSVNKNFDNVLKNNYYITNIKYLPNTINTKEY